MIIDVLSDKQFQKEHIKDAVNYCIYETAFSDKVQKDISKDEKIEVYGFSDETEEAKLAKKTLESLGYEFVSIIKGGLVEWKKQEKPIESTPEKIAFKSTYTIDTEKSRVEWTGRNIGNKHTGSVAIQGGSLRFDEGAFSQFEIKLDMNSLTNFDLDSQDYKDMLITHLKSDDFFSVEKYPSVLLKSIEISSISTIDSLPNYHVIADLTIKGITKKIEFDANVHLKEGNLVINAHFDIDRTKWDVKYGSEKFFAALGMHIISDILSFDVILMGK